MAILYEGLGLGLLWIYLGYIGVRGLWCTVLVDSLGVYRGLGFI